jgi:hypothetical protein
MLKIAQSVKIIFISVLPVAKCTDTCQNDRQKRTLEAVLIGMAKRRLRKCKNPAVISTGKYGVAKKNRGLGESRFVEFWHPGPGPQGHCLTPEE